MPLWKGKKGWRYQFQWRGQRYSRAWFVTKAEARTAMENHRAQIRDQKQTSELSLSALDLETLMVSYLTLAERRKAAKTVEYRKIVFRRFLAFTGNPPVASITPTLVENYLLTRPTNNNFNKDRTELNTLFNWALRRGHILSNPVFLVDKVPVERPQKVIPTPEEMGRILMAAGEYRPFLLVVVLTLARVGEITQLAWQDVNFEHKVVKLRSRKNKTGSLIDRDIPMSDGLYEVLWQVWEKRRSDDWVFPSPVTGNPYLYRRKVMRTVCKRAGVRHFGFHAIRHWVASYLFDRKKVGLAMISKLLGHTNFQTTERYLQLIDPQMRTAIAHLDDDFFKTYSQTYS
ncbi:MAG: tyrosine-type recombinase/integrase [Desulfobacteraceae bacterium]